MESKPQSFLVLFPLSPGRERVEKTGGRPALVRGLESGTFSTLQDRLSSQVSRALGRTRELRGDSAAALSMLFSEGTSSPLVYALLSQLLGVTDIPLLRSMETLQIQEDEVEQEVRSRGSVRFPSPPSLLFLCFPTSTR